MKLWIRLEADAPRDPAVGHLADLLSIPPRQAFGYVVAVWCAMGEHAPDGSLRHVSSATLEDWAGWVPGRGKKAGDFARAFLTIFTENGVDAEFRDNQGALVQRMERDRRRKFHGISTEIPRNDLGNSNATERNGTEQQKDPSPPREAHADRAGLIARLPETYRRDADELFASIPNEGPFLAEAAAALDGMGGHHIVTPEQLGGALREFHGDKAEHKLSLFRGYLRSAGRPRAPRPSRNGNGRIPPGQYEYTPTLEAPKIR